MDWLNKCHFGDVRDVLRQMIAAGVLVNTVVTSPPYFGLRSYLPDGHPDKAKEIGLEQTPELFIAGLVDVFRLVRELLADDGTLWVNMGDSYASRPNGSIGATGLQGGLSPHVANRTAHARRSSRIPEGYKHKDLIGIPWMLAFALRADGWYLRQDIIWHKPNPMPESVTDRCTKSHEYLFLLSKSPRYHFDQEAIRDPAVGGLAGNVRAAKGAQAYIDGDEKHRTKAGLSDWAERQRSRRNSFARSTKDSAGEHGQKPQFRPDREDVDYGTETRNKRSVWTVATTPYSGAHFATFPAELIEPCVMAGCPAGGIVLDPFFGSGTTGQVAQALGRQFIGIDINPANEPLQRERLRQPSLNLEAA